MTAISPQRTFDLVARSLLAQREPAREPWGPVLLDREGRRSALGHLLGARLQLTSVASLELLGSRRVAHELLRCHDQVLVLALETAHDRAAWLANGDASLFASGELSSPERWLPLWERAMRCVARQLYLSTAVLDHLQEAAA